MSRRPRKCDLPEIRQITPLGEAPASKAASYAKYIAVELDSYTGDMMKAIQESYHYLTSTGIARSNK